MNLRAFSGLGLLVGTLTASGLLAIPAHAADGTDIDYIEVSDRGEVSVLVGVDGLAGSASPDLGSVEAEVAGKPVEAQAETIRAGEIERTTVLALDASRSMAGGRFLAAKAAAKAFLEAAPDDVRIGLVTFSGEIQDVTEPTTNHAAVADAIDSIGLTLGTHVYGAVVEAVNLTGGQGARSVLVLSDGQDQGDGTPLGEAVETAEAAGVVVDVVAVEQSREDLAPLAQIADASGGTVFAADDSDALESLFLAQADALATQVLVKFSQPPGVAGEASISVSMAAGGQTYTDSALVTLAEGGIDSGPAAVETEQALVGETGLFIGAGVLAVGLAALLATVILGGRRAPTMAQRQLAHYSGHSQAQPVAPATTGASLRQSAVAMTEKVVKGDFETRLAQKLNGAGIALTAAEWLLLHAGIATAAAFVGFLARGPALMILLLIAGGALPWLYVKQKHSRRIAAFGAQLAETLQLLAGGLSAGLSLAQSIDTVVREGHEPMAGEMKRALIEQRLGIDIEEALDGIGERMSSEDFKWVVMAIRIQREVGGNLAELLNTVAATIREREYLRRQVKVLSAEGRMSAYVLGGLPILMFIYMLFVRPDVIRPLYTEPIGMLLSLAAVVLLLAGFFTLSKIVKIEV